MTRPVVAVRPLGPADSCDLALLHAQLFDPAWSKAEFDRLLRASTTLGVAAVGRVDGAPDAPLAGAAVAQVVADEADLLTVMVRAECQRSGIGRAVLTALERRLACSGVTRIILEVGSGNVAARALYTAQGFRPVAERRDYYAAGSPLAGTALVMEKLVGDVAIRPLSLRGPQ